MIIYWLLSGSGNVVILLEKLNHTKLWTCFHYATALKQTQILHASGSIVICYHFPNNVYIRKRDPNLLMQVEIFFILWILLKKIFLHWSVTTVTSIDLILAEEWLSICFETFCFCLFSKFVFSWWKFRNVENLFNISKLL